MIARKISYLVLILLVHSDGNLFGQKKMKQAYLKFSVIAIDKERFMAVRNCRELHEKNDQDSVAVVLLNALTALDKNTKAIARYAKHYAAYGILSITYTPEIIRIGLEEQMDLLRDFIHETGTSKRQEKFQDVCTAYISLQASLVFPEFWFHPYANMLKSEEVSSAYIDQLSKNPAILRSGVLTDAPEDIVDPQLFWSLTGLRDQDVLDNRFYMFDKSSAEKMLADLSDVKVTAATKVDHQQLSDFLAGVVTDKTILIFQYFD
jgi:hypothetical protein